MLDLIIILTVVFTWAVIGSWVKLSVAGELIGLKKDLFNITVAIYTLLSKIPKVGPFLDSLSQKVFSPELSAKVGAWFLK